MPCTPLGGRRDPGLQPLPWREMTENLGDRDGERLGERPRTRRHKLGLGLSLSEDDAPRHTVRWAGDRQERKVAVEGGAGDHGTKRGEEREEGRGRVTLFPGEVRGDKRRAQAAATRPV